MVDSSMSFDKCLETCINHYKQDTEEFLTPNDLLLLPLWSVALQPHILAATHLFSLPIILSFSVSCKCVRT